MGMARRHASTEAGGAEATAVRRPSLLNPVVDYLCVGGLSLIFFVPLLLSGRSDLLLVGAGVQAWLGTMINMPHFMASYRLVYRNRETMMRHKWASMYVPGILIAYVLVAIWASQYSRVMVIILISVGSAYLAWHYTGQVWGMMASFAFLNGTAFDGTERRLIRTSLRVLLVWHISWFLYTQLSDPSRVRPLYLVASNATLVAFALGAVGLVRMWRRTGHAPPPKSLVAWLALFAWYAVIARDPRALFWVQIAHALQYLAFPVRVEMNRTRAAEPSGQRLALHMAAYGVGLLAVSALISLAVPKAAMVILGDMFGEEPARAAPILILVFINIHHYFTDGVIWHISNPEVRQELFAHVPRPKRA